MQEKSLLHHPLELLARLLDHPHGKELANLVYQLCLYRDTQTDTQPNPQLIAIALSKAKALGIKDIPYFKSMTNEGIRRWITQHF